MRPRHRSHPRSVPVVGELVNPKDPIGPGLKPGRMVEQGTSLMISSRRPVYPGLRVNAFESARSREYQPTRDNSRHWFFE